MTQPRAPKINTLFNFTKKALEEKFAEFIAHSDKAQITCTDANCIGLNAVMFRQSKAVSFRARASYNGTRPSYPLGDLGKHFTVDQARSACAVVRLDAKQGRDPRANKRAQMTFYELVTELYFPLTQHQKRSAKDDVQKFECRLRERFGNKLASAITSVDVSNFLSGLVAVDGLSPATTNRYRALLRSIFALAVDEGIVDRNPVKNIRHPRRQVADNPPVSCCVWHR